MHPKQSSAFIKVLLINKQKRLNQQQDTRKSLQDSWVLQTIAFERNVAAIHLLSWRLKFIELIQAINHIVRQTNIQSSVTYYIRLFTIHLMAASTISSPVVSLLEPSPVYLLAAG